MICTLYSCGCSNTAKKQGPDFCDIHGREYIIRGNWPDPLKKRKFIRKNYSVYLCSQPEEVPFKPVSTDLVVINNMYDLTVANVRQFFGGNKVLCLLLDNMKTESDVRTFIFAGVPMNMGTHGKNFQFHDIHTVENGSIISEYRTLSGILAPKKLEEFAECHRSVGCFFEKWLITQVKPKRVVHVNAKSLRWLKAAKETDTPYVAQTVNPLVYNLMVDSEKLERIQLSEHGITK
jgi:hypothetical protein